MDILESWQNLALNIGYFDEEYQASQMWKADWEAVNGNRVATRARATVVMLEPLRGPVGGTLGGKARPKRPNDNPGRAALGDGIRPYSPSETLILWSEYEPCLPYHREGIGHSPSQGRGRDLHATRNPRNPAT